MLPGYPSKPRFRILASGSVWIRSDQGGLLDVLAPAGSFVEEGRSLRLLPIQSFQVFSMTSSPPYGAPNQLSNTSVRELRSPIGHLLPVKRGVSTLKRRLDDEGCLIISGSDGEPPWRRTMISRTSQYLGSGLEDPQMQNGVQKVRRTRRKTTDDQSFVLLTTGFHRSTKIYLGRRQITPLFSGLMASLSGLLRMLRGHLVTL